jgi:perosamine synthetase
MSNLQAAVAYAQIKNLKKVVKLKFQIAEYYNKFLSKSEFIKILPNKNSYSRNIYWVYGIVLKQNSKKNVSDIISYLKNNGVGSRNFFYPMHKQPILIREGYFKDVSLPNSEYLSNCGFYIPSGLNLNEEEMELISEGHESHTKFVVRHLLVN